MLRTSHDHQPVEIVAMWKSLLVEDIGFGDGIVFFFRPNGNVGFCKIIRVML
jgi:hypothetical protein